MKQIVFSYDASHTARYVADNCKASDKGSWPTEPTQAKVFTSKAHAQQCVDILAQHHGINAQIEQYKPSFHGRSHV